MTTETNETTNEEVTNEELTNEEVTPVDYLWVPKKFLRGLNKVVKMMFSNADGVSNPNTVRIGPRRMVFTGDVGNIKPYTGDDNDN